MTKIIFLLPPSEGKKAENKYYSEKLSFKFEKPCTIAKNVEEKDLKCKGKRFLEGLEFNKILCSKQSTSKKKLFIEAMKRYSGVMFSAIDYENMNKKGKIFFEQNFLILSGMYGIVKPLDIIGNYKLPIDTKGLFYFWGEKIVKNIIDLKPNYIINLLPISYSKLLGLSKCKKHIYKKELLTNAGIEVINVDFLKQNGDKISHGVKKIKGEWIKNICENGIENSSITLPFKEI